MGGVGRLVELAVLRRPGVPQQLVVAAQALESSIREMAEHGAAQRCHTRRALDAATAAQPAMSTPAARARAGQIVTLLQQVLTATSHPQLSATAGRLRHAHTLAVSLRAHPDGDGPVEDHPAAARSAGGRRTEPRPG